VCFFVDLSMRGRGLAEHLLEAGLDYARSKGAERVEAYPIDKAVRVDNEVAFVGTKPMFNRAGFREVARRKPNRPVMRIELGS
jgi:GNAT superfamily N-acetyltransferase